MSKRKLTIKQKKFADLYIKTGNGTQSYKDAGYSATTDAVADANARRLLGNERVRGYIDQKMQELEDSQIAKAEEVLKFLTSVMRGEETEEIPLLIGEGVQDLTDKQVGARERIRAAELLARRYALLTDKVEVEGTVGAVIIDDVPDEDE